MQTFSPAFMAGEADEKSFTGMLERCSEERDFFKRFLKIQIEQISTIQKSRKLCAAKTEE